MATLSATPVSMAALMALLAFPACLNEYHPEYHPETVYSYTQTIKVNEPQPTPTPTTIVIVTSPPPPLEQAVPPPPARTRVRPARTLAVVDAGEGIKAVTARASASGQPAFQAAPVFVADDRGP